jgi:hypothetical protein
LELTQLFSNQQRIFSVAVSFQVQLEQAIGSNRSGVRMECERNFDGFVYQSDRPFLQQAFHRILGGGNDDIY